MTDATLKVLEDLNQRAQLALQRENRSTAQERWREILAKVPAPINEEPQSEPSSSQHALAAQACFSLQQSLDEADNELDDDDEDEGEDQDEPGTRSEQIELLRRALSHVKVLSQPTTAQQDLEAGLMLATLASLLLCGPTAEDAVSTDSPKQLFDSALESIKSASVKRKGELLTALRPTSSHTPGTNKESQDIAGALQLIYDAPSSHFVHLAAELPLDELDAFAKSIQAFFDNQVPSSMGAIGKGETALNVGEVLVDRLEEEEEEEEDEEEEDKDSKSKEQDQQVVKIKEMACSWLQQAVKLFEEARKQAPESQTDELDFQLGHALSLLHDVTPSDSAEAEELMKKMEALGISVDDDEWEDEDDE